jgi:50S ribosomal protein L16 3-hydroxylase
MGTRILEELLAPSSLEAFLAKHYRRNPMALPSTASRFDGLLQWDMVKEIIENGHEDVCYPRQGKLPDYDFDKVTYSEAQLAFQRGRTVLVRHSERSHPHLRKIAEDFYSIFKKPIDIQLYFTPAGEEGFDWHYDLEDVFIIQSYGKKEFLLRKNTVNPNPGMGPLPKDQHFELESTRAQHRCVLHAGDWLYIPAGYWHKARAVEDSHHLSVGVMSCAQEWKM